MNNKEKYIEVFKSVFDVEGDVLDEKFNFGDVAKWDSMTHLMLISELENAFDVMFETDDILHFGGFLNGQKILSGYGVEFDD